MGRSNTPLACRVLASLVVLGVALTACGGSDEGAADGAEDGSLRLTFDGESCTYEGPTELKAGPVEFVFLNESEVSAAAALVIHDEGYSIQDGIDSFGEEEPSTGHAPWWTTEIRGVWAGTGAGESHHWEGDLEPGIHLMACARLSPFGAWFGSGLTVED